MTKTCFSCGEQFTGNDSVCGSCQNQRQEALSQRILTLPLSQLSSAEKRAKAVYFKNHVDEMAKEYEQLYPVYKPNRLVLLSARIFITTMFIVTFGPFFMWIIGAL